jgi:yecA family protein
MNLESFLRARERPAGTLTPGELRGFVFALACAPEEIPDLDWMAVIFADQAPGYANPAEEVAVSRSLVAMYRDVAFSLAAGRVPFPVTMHAGEAALQNFEAQAPLREWARGFCIGHEYLARLWDAHVPERERVGLARCVATLSFFADAALAERHRPREAALAATREEIAAAVVERIPEALRDYARRGRALRRALLRYGSRRGTPARATSTVGRNDPCPCGSGKKFKQCCLGKSKR